MNSHPVNLALRFVLEIVVLIVLGYWGWQQGDGAWQIVLAVMIPLIAAVLWGTFRVRNDPGPAPVAIPGVLRLVLELGLFTFGVWALFSVGADAVGYMLGVVVIAHYVISFDRVVWLLKH